MTLPGRTKIAAAILVAGSAAVAAWATAPQQKQKNTPENWSWEMRDGKRVPRGERTTNLDGSWREVIRRGDCEVVREKSAKGEYRETRRCD